MSEYQYYEFQAIDRPLTGRQMEQLRQYSSRAQITPTSFVNEYNWGDFKGDEDEWMERYFDAFLYFANWGTRTFRLRLPVGVLDPEVGRAYLGGRPTSVRQTKGNVILTFGSELDGGDDFGELEGPGVLSSLLPVRAELAHGDRRALYLGWLAAVQSGEFEDAAVEPTVPPGLGQLSGSLAALAAFLRVDSDLLDVAAQTSPAQVEWAMRRNEIAAWIASLPPAEKDGVLTQLLVEPENHRLPAELLQRFLKASEANGPAPASTPQRRRTVGALWHAAEERTAKRESAAELEAAELKVRGQRDAAVARAHQLDRLAGQELRLWVDIDRLIVTRLPKDYDQAVLQLVDLRDLAARGDGAVQADFAARIERFRAAHARKPSLLARLVRAGL